MTENDLALQMTAQVVALETVRRYGSHSISEREVSEISDECKRLARLITSEFNTKKKTISDYNLEKEKKRANK